MDTDGDGEPETYDAPRYDLKLVHSKTNGVIWVREIPLDANHAEKALDVLVGNYAESMSGSGFYAEDLANDRIATAKTFATRILDQKPMVVSGREAVDATIELANVEQLKLASDSRQGKVRVIFVKAGCKRDLGLRTTSAIVPLLTMIGYYNDPAHFDALIPEFDAFVKSMTFDDGSK